MPGVLVTQSSPAMIYPPSSRATRFLNFSLFGRMPTAIKTIVFGLTGTGYFDMFAYGRYNDGEMSDYIPTDAELQAGFDGIPKI